MYLTLLGIHQAIENYHHIHVHRMQNISRVMLHRRIVPKQDHMMIVLLTQSKGATSSIPQNEVTFEGRVLSKTQGQENGKQSTTDQQDEERKRSELLKHKEQ